MCHKRVSLTIRRSSSVASIPGLLREYDRGAVALALAAFDANPAAGFPDTLGEGSADAGAQMDAAGQAERPRAENQRDDDATHSWAARTV